MYSFKSSTGFSIKTIIQYSLNIRTQSDRGWTAATPGKQWRLDREWGGLLCATTPQRRQPHALQECHAPWLEGGDLNGIQSKNIFLSYEYFSKDSSNRNTKVKSKNFNSTLATAILLQPENLYLASPTSDELKVIDFGFSRLYHPVKKVAVKCATPEFCSPEVASDQVVTPASDMWSVGVITYLLWVFLFFIYISSIYPSSTYPSSIYPSFIYPCSI